MNEFMKFPRGLYSFIIFNNLVMIFIYYIYLFIYLFIYLLESLYLLEVMLLD